MSRAHRRELSIVRLTQPLPPLPLPLEDIPSPPPKEARSPPYRDVEESSTSFPESQPPGYEPMHDYLRTHRPLLMYPPRYESSSSPPLLSHTNTRAQTQIPTTLPYRDEPFIVTIDPPPPSYDEVYLQHQEHMQRLIREFDENGSPSERSEEIFKWFVSMLIIALTIAAVGMAFNWGKCSTPALC